MRPLPRGFTLIEQLAVISLVGTAAAAALPALVELQAHAADTTLASLASAAGSAMALNQAGCLVTGQQSVAGKCQPVRDCADVATLLMGEIPTGYAVLPQPLAPHGSTCTLQRLQDGANAAFHGAATGS